MKTKKGKNKKPFKKEMEPKVISAGFYDLSDEEIEELRDTTGVKYPEKNKHGQKLFDANGNIPDCTLA